MKICSNCVLPASFPGVSFDEENLCNHCRKFNGKREKLHGEKKKCKQNFLELLNQVVTKRRNHAAKGSRRGYDVLMSYSGGKDSTYTLCLLRNKYRLRVLALTVDNNFLSETALRNIRTVADELGADHMLFRPAWKHLRKIFSTAADRELFSKKAIERASTVCMSCMGIVKSICLKTAIDLEIPLIGYGSSPGQVSPESAILKNNPSFIRSSQQEIMKPLRAIIGSEIEAYFLNEAHYSNADKLPYNVHPLAWEPYNETAILEEIKKIGWSHPRDTDGNSTNCALNAYANDVHIRRYGFHPYVWEIAGMVREGIMTREEGCNKIYVDQELCFIEKAREKLSR